MFVGLVKAALARVERMAGEPNTVPSATPAPSLT